MCCVSCCVLRVVSCAVVRVLRVSSQRYYKGELYFIDVSQSVEHDHPHALDFLRLVRTSQLPNIESHDTRDTTLATRTQRAPIA